MSGTMRTQLQNFVLELDGKLAGRLFSVDGGTVRTQIIDEPIGLHNERIKHTSQFDLQPLVLICGTGMSQVFYKWIAGAFDGRGQQRMSGAVILLDQNSKPRARREFYNAIVVEVVLPALDSSQKDSAYMQVTIQPEQGRTDSTSETVDLGVYAARLAKNWYINGFRFQIEGLVTDSQHVTHIDSIDLKQGMKKMYTGQDRFPQIEPTKVEFPNINFEVPATHGEGFLKWYNESVKGNGTSVQPRSGSIEFLAPGSNTPYFGLGLNGVGPFSLQRQGANALRIGLYCDSMTFRAGSAAIK